MLLVLKPSPGENRPSNTLPYLLQSYSTLQLLNRRAMAGPVSTKRKRKRQYQFEPLLPESKADIVEKNLGPFVPFPSWMTQKISQKLCGMDVLGLVGPPGSGKKTLLRQASPVPVREYTVDRLLGLNHLSEFKRALQQTLDGPCIWMVHPAELLTEELVKAMVKYKGWQTKVVPVGNDKNYGLSKVIYHNSAKHVKAVANKIGATGMRLLLVVVICVSSSLQ